jgi:hypothetical protein
MKNFTDITFILDRSGSMQSRVADVLGGYKAFVEDQQKLGDNACLSLVLFDTTVDTMFAGVPIKAVNPVLDYRLGGMTALIDAIGQTIAQTGARLSALPEQDRPNKVIVVVMTDGEENASRQFTNVQIKQMVETQTQTYGWTFLFLGANIDSFSVAGNLGFNSTHTTNYSNDAKGFAGGLRGMSTYTSTLRSSDGLIIPDTLAEHYADAILANDTQGVAAK